MGRIDETRIRDLRAFFVSLRLPGRQRLARELDRLVPGLPVEVVAGHEVQLVPRAGQQRARFPINDVLFQRERQMIFEPRGLDLLFLALGKDIVSQHVVFAVVLMETARLGAVDEVVLEENARAAFIGIHSPAAVGIGINVVEDVVADHACLRRGRAYRCRPCRSAGPSPGDGYD